MWEKSPTKPHRLQQRALDLLSYFEITIGIPKNLILNFQPNSFQVGLLKHLSQDSQNLSHSSYCIMALASSSHLPLTSNVLSAESMKILLYKQDIIFFECSWLSTISVLFEIGWYFSDFVPFFVCHQIMSYLKIPKQIIRCHTILGQKLREWLKGCSHKQLIYSRQTYLRPFHKTPIQFGCQKVTNRSYFCCPW